MLHLSCIVNNNWIINGNRRQGEYLLKSKRISIIEKLKKYPENRTTEYVNFILSVF